MTCATATDWQTQYRGDTWCVPVASFKDGSPEDLSGAELTFTLKALISDPDPGALQRRVVVPAGPAAANGVAEIVVPSSLSALVAPGAYFFDVQRVFPGTPPNVRTLDAGEFRVLADVTRNAGDDGCEDCGPPAPPPSGACGASVIRNSYLSSAPISALRAVRVLPNGLLGYADPLDLTSAGTVIGISSSAAASPGEPVSVVEFGPLSDDIWNWTPGLPLFFTANGVLTQSVPTTGYLLQVASAETPNFIRVAIAQPIYL
ncbi:hypothetical protein [Nevskia sp.]|uniref:hypothetical protein n=1 Tax=Nevskia sp. TaxID=1929292 RepID=UPI0025FF4B48|nr:hypothetical protein [Nevskia sp.]